MKLIGLRLALQTAILAVLFSSAAQAQNRPALSNRDLQAKIQYCKTCHGLSGQGYRGASPMPRLAGQQTEYLENQLRAFVERRRENKLMYGVSHALDPTTQTAIAAHFRDLDPKPVGGAPKELVATGKKIYEEGTSNAPPCASCHGREAKGNGAFPRLAGQLHDYIFNKLMNWTKERGQDPKTPDTSAIMEPIAHNLIQSQMSAVAAYLSYQQ
jgi:cytochrome c553